MKVSKLVLIIGFDVVWFSLSFLATWLLLELWQWENIYFSFPLYLSFLILFMISLYVYSVYSVLVYTVFNLIKALSLFFLTSFLIYFFLSSYNEGGSSLFFLILYGVFLVSIPFRLLIFHLILLRRVPFIYLTVNARHQDYINHFLTKKYTYYQIRAVFNPFLEKLSFTRALPIIHSQKELSFLIKQDKIKYIVIDDEDIPYYYQYESLFREKELYIIPLSHFIEIEEEYIPYWSTHKRWFFYCNRLNTVYNLIFKRLFDLFLVLILLPWTLLILPVLMFLVWISSRGPIFYIDKRYGAYQKPYYIYKLRTMYINIQRDTSTKINDDRVTWVGRILRKTHLDELPQIFNILIGQMTFCGIRPDTISLIENIKEEIPYYIHRYNIKPALIGWHSVHNPYLGSNYTDSLQKLTYDLYYLKNISFILDLKILLRTLQIVLESKGK